jgi:endonuclease YncB( thermonuclease family)
LISSQLEEPSQRLATSARVKRIIDGDTLVLEVTKELRVRMLDCWAAEIRTKNLEEKNKGLAAKKYLESLINTDDIVLVDIPITEKLQDSISLGRFLAYIYADTDGDGILDNISDLMVKAGHATKSKPAIGKNDE